MVAPLELLAQRSGRPALAAWLGANGAHVRATVLEGARGREPVAARLRLVPAALSAVNAYVSERHYLHRGRVMAQVAYWLLIDAPASLEGNEPVREAPPGSAWRLAGHPIAGAILFALPRLSKRFQGYHPMEVLELARLYVEPAAVLARAGIDLPAGPGGNPRHLAGAAMGRAIRLVRRDWREKYPRLPKPRAIVSWSDTTRHDGTVYRAAGFVDVGATRPRSGQRTHAGARAHGDLEHAKRGWILPLEAPDAARHEYVLGFELSGLTRASARELCDELADYAASIGLDVPRSGRCHYHGAPYHAATFEVPLTYAADVEDGAAEPLGDLADRLGEVFVELSANAEYVADSDWAWGVVRVTPATFERARTGQWVRVPGTLEDLAIDDLEDEDEDDLEDE